MFRKDKNACFGYKFRPSTITGDIRNYYVYPFEASVVYVRIPEKQYNEIMQNQNETPQAVANNEFETWWMFQDEFYWTDDIIEAEDVKSLIPAAHLEENLEAENAQLLVLAKQLQEKRKMESDILRAKAIVSKDTDLQNDGRQPIPDGVKMFVWQRDNGHCVKCGSKENLEYDHIIPVSQGGGNTARNLQILCEYCNRSKGGNLF
jgi:NADH pyrophosphatase NudC (nudix superfamily)